MFFIIILFAVILLNKEDDIHSLIDQVIAIVYTILLQFSQCYKALY